MERIFLTHSPSSRYPSIAAANSAAPVWTPVSVGTNECHSNMSAFFVPMHLQGCMGERFGVAGTLLAGRPTPMWPFFVFGRTNGAEPKTVGSPYHAQTPSTPFSYLHDRDDLPESIKREVQS